MQALFDAVNAICAKIQIVSNWFWDFPCNLDWYGSIPIWEILVWQLFYWSVQVFTLPSVCTLYRCTTLSSL